MALLLLCALLAGAAVLHTVQPGTRTATAAQAAPTASPAVAGDLDENNNALPSPAEGSASLPGNEAAPTAPVAPGEPAPDGGTAPAPQPASGDAGVPAPQPAPTPEPREVALQWGDTLWELARRHHTTVQTLQELNGLGSSTLIHAGATLRVPDPGGVPAAANASNNPSAPGSPATKGASPRVGDRPQSAGTPPRGDATASTDTVTGTAWQAGAKAPEAGRGAAAAVAYARAQLGKPYRWGASGPDAFDCSGLVMRAWQAAGAGLPRTTWDMVRAGKRVGRAALVPGDLVITNGGAHVQLYIGDGKVVHAPGTGKHVTVAALPAAGKVLAYRHVG
ncbi:NlpC/P60 family protein [Kitasatospora herbaricolor]|uniref:NlpC/P60 family protein n=1 Tax=Kitasatospora herbaricolor TaxID=68217 RepID=A0ABZ1WGY1_9ACTN|nr:NlpC/P60 family protein [Kitasatospora herbaricolor]